MNSLWLVLLLLHCLNVMVVPLHEHQLLKVSICQGGSLSPQDVLSYLEQASNCSTGWDGCVELGEQFHQHWFTQEGNVTQDLLRAALQPDLYQVLCLCLQRPVTAAALSWLSDGAQEVRILTFIAVGGARLPAGLS